MEKKESLEQQLLQESCDLDHLRHNLFELDRTIIKLLKEKNTYYNQYWGSVFRAGAEETFFTYQVERYACIYMARLADLFSHSPLEYYRAARRNLPHELST